MQLDLLQGHHINKKVISKIEEYHFATILTSKQLFSRKFIEEYSERNDLNFKILCERNILFDRKYFTFGETRDIRE